MNHRDEVEKLIREYRGAIPLHLGIIYLGLDERTKSLDYFEKALA